MKAKIKARTLYFFKGKFRTEKDILDPNTQSGAYVPIANRIRDDRPAKISEALTSGRLMRAISTI